MRFSTSLMLFTIIGAVLTMTESATLYRRAGSTNEYNDPPPPYVEQESSTPRSANTGSLPGSSNSYKPATGKKSTTPDHSTSYIPAPTVLRKYVKNGEITRPLHFKRPPDASERLDWYLPSKECEEELYVLRESLKTLTPSEYKAMYARVWKVVLKDKKDIQPPLSYREQQMEAVLRFYEWKFPYGTGWGTVLADGKEMIDLRDPKSWEPRAYQAPPNSLHYFRN
ncbi:hypothetical protein BC835DRAFT_1411951 [Cytidiella melzeri]|nr:hypothetical protein BC835DRAFT_1411951 [Cytidiella melzeri]